MKLNFSPTVTKRAWRPSWCEDDGDGLEMSPTESRAASPAQPYIGHQKESKSGDDPRTPGVGLWKGSSRPYSTPGEPFRSWPRTDRSGDPLLLPYMPGGIHGHE